MVKKESEDIEMDVGETAPIVFSWDKLFDSIVAKGIFLLANKNIK